MKSKIIYTCFIFLGLFIILIAACKKDKEEKIDCTGVSPSYNSEVKSIINANCLSSGCHEAGSSNGDYTTYDGLKAVATSGTLESRTVTNKTMPPSSPLSLEDRKKIKCWISAGALNN
jgi:hypothetical protein